MAFHDRLAMTMLAVPIESSRRPIYALEQQGSHMPQYCDAFMSDVVIVIDDEHYPFDEMVEQLKSHGAHIQDLRPDQHVIEASIESSKLRTIDDLPGVNYVRAVFTYAADFPSGDPRDKDAEDRQHYADETTPAYTRNNGYRKI